LQGQAIMVNRSVRPIGAAARVVALGALSLLTAAAPGRAQEAKSPDTVKELTQLLDAKKLDSIAAADPQSPGVYVGALYFPGSQLLVVSAKYAAPPLLNEKLAKKDYREVYIDLSSASVAGSKLFVMDTNADGLNAKPGDDQPFDTVERAGTSIAFDGAWKKTKMSEAEYMKAFAEVDAAYVHALQLLINQLKSQS
jgi:hypothetical protein